jgi:hypothetical protein
MPAMNFFSSQKGKDILLLFAWSLFLLLCTHSIQAYFLADKPPFWDNLAYQNDALAIFRRWLDGDWRSALKEIDDSRVPGHVVSLASSYLLFGMQPNAPYMISALFGFGCLSVVYLLSVELGASRKAAFWGAVIWSILPNFLYQNFLQTRNDFQLAFFIGLSWLFFLQAVRREENRKAFWAGISVGIGTLFKASAPGYVVFAVLPFLLFPVKYLPVDFRSRGRLILSFVAGAVLASGWHYLPHLQETLRYYVTWGKDATAWKASQYQLQLSWHDYLFYPKNIVYSHWGVLPALCLALVLFVLLLRKFALRRRTEIWGQNEGNAFLALTFCAVIIPLIFISWRESYSSLGDVPVLVLLTAGVIALISRHSGGFVVHRYLLVPLVLLGLSISLPNIPIAESQFIAKDLGKFNGEISDFRKEYGLQDTQMVQVFSHPIYNVNFYQWAALVGHKDRSSIPMDIRNMSNIMFPEDANLIASKLSQFPMVIISDFPGTAIGGETFHAFNRLHDGINKALEKNGQFIKLRKISLEDGKFPVYLALNKDYVKFNPVQVTADQWTEWGADVDYFSFKPSRLVWRGITARPVSEFRLVDKKDSGSTIILRLKQVSSEGIGEYLSDVVPGSEVLRTYEMLPNINTPAESASAQDSRKLAFYRVETKVITDDSEQ